ncbi:MAG TPA: hypothetical protein VMS00_05295, partial [Acidimicrobiales bacterium]|nr:hypothetical protein [Acidimicrobiales bacterium]
CAGAQLLIVGGHRWTTSVVRSFHADGSPTPRGQVLSWCGHGLHRAREACEVPVPKRIGAWHFSFLYLDFARLL